ncbi:hypothetical protein ERO13_A13G029700v2 [Gossypium hirsutum]|uniref:Uncharacterized protein n=2 Tax=Gossypium TaxID=3633 RepID=A0A5J5SXX0_GOSBA|nr:hypothetical protein ES319_A13G031100v1 [Gossypium barbadense]KAG4164643.1 hypothetical protein ERO13_A13G029700v2 [Gossypium hirsutum]TYG85142.1 hypothetical protein ES288_A13G029300v1 [Gossypium darwinii]
MSGDRVSRCPLRSRCGPMAGVARMGFFRRQEANGGAEEVNGGSG